METTEITNIIHEAEQKIANIKEMLADYEACKNDTSKSCLMTVMLKLANQLKVQQIAR